MATGGAGSTISPRNIPPHPSQRGAVAPAPATPATAVSPPSKRELASWWKKFRKQEKVDDKVDTASGIFSVPLAESIRYANVAISLTNEQGESFIYGYVPIVVAKCGVFLKEKATDVEGIFRLSGSAKRIKDLQVIFNSPDRYGKGLDWTGYTVHDAANILRRYLNQLPEPIVPLEFYERFREPLRKFQARPMANGETHPIDMSMDQHGTAVIAYQKLITELPPLNRQLLLYILDLLAVFASKSDLNRMTAANLAAIFQPGIISHPNHDMAPMEYRLSQDVLIFLIENQDNFLIGMTGTGVDERTKAEVESGAPSVRSPKSNIGRSASNASAGADSLRKYSVRRNVSVSSHNSRERSSPGVSSPGTPTGQSQFQPTPASTGIARSNTVPSKRSPAVPGGRFQRVQEGSPAASPVASPVLPSPGPGVETSNASLEAAQKLQTQSQHPTSAQPAASSEAPAVQQPTAPVLVNTAPAAPQQNRERKISSLFARSPIFAPTDPSRPQRKLQKRSRIPGSANESAENSQTSLYGDDAPTPAFHTPLVSPELLSNSRADPMSNPALTNTAATPVNETARSPTSAERPNNTSQPPHLQPPRSPAGSVHSRSSVTDQSEFDQLDTPTSAPAGDRKKSRWRFSSSAKRSEDFPLAPPPPIGSIAGARGSNSSVGSSGFGRSEGRSRKSFTNESQATTQHDNASTIGGNSTLVPQSSHESNEPLRDTTNREVGDERKGGLFGKWKAKISERRDEKDRAKSPPPQGHPQIGHPSRHGTDNSSEGGKSRGSLSAFAQEHFTTGMAVRRSFDSGSRPRGQGSEPSIHALTTSPPAGPTQSGPGELETVKERPLSEATIAEKRKEEVAVAKTPEQAGNDEVDKQGPTGLGIQEDENVSPRTKVGPAAPELREEPEAAKEEEGEKARSAA